MSVMCNTIELCHVSRNVTMTSDIDPLPCPYSLPPSLQPGSSMIIDKESKINSFRHFFLILETSSSHPSTCPFHHRAVSMASLSAFL